MREVSVKEFEIVLDSVRHPAQEALRPYFASNRQADRLTFKNIFRHAARHDLMLRSEACERWLAYRDNRNDRRIPTMERHFTRRRRSRLLPDFIEDARELARVIAEDRVDD